MPPFLSQLSIRNFRSCSSTELELSNFTALIGYNNSGKSNILSAIQWLLKKSKLIQTDYNNPNSPVEVTAMVESIEENDLSQMNERQRNQIEPYIFDKKIQLRRIQNPFVDSSQDQKLFVFDQNQNHWVANPTGIDNALSAILPDVIRIGAMENANEDASKAKNTTTIGKLLSEFIKPVQQAHQEELNTYIGEIENRLSADGSLRFSELNNIDSSINSKIEDFFPGIRIRLDFPVQSFDDLIKSGTLKVYEETGPSRPFSYYGHGAQRSIQMALVRHLADIKKIHQAGYGTTILLIDEPELYLHPIAIEQIREALISLSKSDYQVIFSTHSAQMVTPETSPDTLLIRKNQEQGTYSRKRMRDAIRTIVPDANHQIEHLFSLGNASQLLFSEKAILTEGKTELYLLPFIFKMIQNSTLGQMKIALVPQGGVDNTRKNLDILKEMDIPAKAIVDLDYALKGAVINNLINEDDHDLCQLKDILRHLSSIKRLTIDPRTSLPTKGPQGSAHEGFVILANEGVAISHINNLHHK